MKENIINKLKELLKYITIEQNTEEFTKLFEYIKKTTNKKLNIKEYTFNNKKALVISNNNILEQDIIFCTHIDIVPATNYSYHEDQNNIYGRGYYRYER